MLRSSSLRSSSSFSSFFGSCSASWICWTFSLLTGSKAPFWVGYGIATSNSSSCSEITATSSLTSGSEISCVSCISCSEIVSASCLISVTWSDSGVWSSTICVDLRPLWFSSGINAGSSLNLISSSCDLEWGVSSSALSGLEGYSCFKWVVKTSSSITSTSFKGLSSCAWAVGNSSLDLS